MRFSGFNGIDVIELPFDVPAEAQARREQDVRGSISGLSAGEELPPIGTALSAGEALPPIGTALSALADEEILLLEGGPTELDEAILGSTEDSDNEDFFFNNGLEATITRAIKSAKGIVAKKAVITAAAKAAPKTTIWAAATAAKMKPGAVTSAIKAAASKKGSQTIAVKAAALKVAPKKINLAATAQSLTKLVADRRQAIATASSEAKKLTARVQKLDVQVKVGLSKVKKLEVESKALASQGKKAESAVKAGAAKIVKAEVGKLDAVRAMDAARAVRYVKVQALGTVLTKNASTQLAAIKLAAEAKAKGNNAAAQTLAKVAVEVGKQSARLKEGRKAQVVKWKVQGAADKVVAAKAIKTEAQRVEKEIKASPMLAPQQKRERLIAVGARIAKADTAVQKASTELKQAGAEAGHFYKGEASDMERIAALRAAGLAGLEGLDAWYGIGNLEDFDGFWDSVKSAASSVGGAAKTAAKAVGGAVKNAADKVKNAGKTVGKTVASAAKKIAGAAKDLVKKGACALANNPAVLKAAAAAAGGLASGGLAAGAAAKGSEYAQGLLSKACPQKASGAADTTGVPENVTSDQQVQSPASEFPKPVLVAIPAGLLLLLFL